MTTRLLDALKKKGTHAVGNLASIKVRTLNHGAKVEGEPIDNFTLVELDFNEDGERVCRQLSDVTKKGYLIASPEARYLGEDLTDFYNDVGEYARIVYLDEGLRFDTSAFEGEAVNGKVAHFDPATKKFIIHDGTHADFANAKAKFLVVGSEEEVGYHLGVPLVRLEVIES